MPTDFLKSLLWDYQSFFIFNSPFSIFHFPAFSSLPAPGAAGGVIPHSSFYILNFQFLCSSFIIRLFLNFYSLVSQSLTTNRPPPPTRLIKYLVRNAG